MNEIVFLLEEMSAEAMLEGLLPRILPSGLPYRFIVFEGKQDLEKQLVRRIRGYLNPNAYFVILRDKDAEDCRALKRKLMQKCCETKKSNILVRIACHELESWYLADLSAVEHGLGVTGIARLQNKHLYRAPDNYPSPYNTLKRIASFYQKVGGSREIGHHLDPDNKRSKSFAVFIEGLRKLCASFTSPPAPN
jgi:hypothetical protein